MFRMQQSGKAQDRTPGICFIRFRRGAVTLPGFQRFEAWDRNRIRGFLNRRDPDVSRTG